MKFYSSHDYVKNIALQTVPSMRYNGEEDFEKWQKDARAKLIELLKIPACACCDEFKIKSEMQCDGCKRFDFEFQSEPGYFVSASFLIPDGEVKKRPVTICIQGHSTGMHISLGEAKYPCDPEDIAGGRDFAVRAVREGCCAVAIEQRYMGTAGLTENGDPACYTENESMAALLMGRTAIGERVRDIMALIDVICKYFGQYIDENKIICLGNSGGGTATFYASCVDERISISVPSCAVCTFEDSIMSMMHCPCNFIPDIRKYFEMGDLGCLIAPRKLLVVCGIEDSIFPLSGVESTFDIIKKAYKIVGKENMCNIVKGNGGHRFYPDQAWPIINKYLEEE